MRNLFLLLTLVGATTLMVTADTKAAGDRGPGSVVGKVSNERGHAVPGATVVIVIHNDRGTHRLRTHSDRHGAFEFPRVPAGHHRIVARKEGVGGDKQRIKVRPRHTTRVHLVLHHR